MSTMDELWDRYLSDGYFDEEGNVLSEYVSRSRVEPIVRRLANDSPPLVNHQLRRFFQHCRAIEAKLRAHTSTWRREEASFRKLDGAAADAYGKKPPKIPELFHDFIKRNVAAVKSQKDFLEGFLPHFEALVGFGSQHIRDRERN